MNAIPHPRSRGFSLLEVLITMLIVSVGLMGLASLLARVQVAELEAYQRSQALILLSDIVERLNVNRKTLPCFRFTTNLTNGTPYIGATGSGWALPTGCAFSTSVYNVQADATLSALNSQLQGLAETKTGAATGSGAMIGARACISYDASTELPDSLGASIANTGLYTITVAWQGMVATAAPAAACANGLYGSVSQRRAVSTTIRFASLTAAGLQRSEGAPWL
ncbi:MAG: prepilin-type N-terminal cleavage/methylation domain-containing protein [Magnetococcales bacterium]|nr:prepilin-type N-terminal cleavage/methylation domain-containing protein [Magnetococcales bacterium]